MMRHKSQKIIIIVTTTTIIEQSFIKCKAHTNWNIHTILHNKYVGHCKTKINPSNISFISFVVYLIDVYHLTLLRTNDFHNIKGKVAMKWDKIWRNERTW